jgi:Pyridoxamine 5'-phosphate oxidase
LLETEHELDELQALLDSSHRGSTEHLRSIINDQRTLTAREIASLMTGMRVLSLATVTRGGEPRISAVDGHFVHARWIFTTSGSAAKARHLRARPAVSAACIEAEEVAVFVHGRVAFLEPGAQDFERTLAHLTEHYGSSPLSWGSDIAICRVEPTWTVGYAFQRDDLLVARGVPIDTTHRT